VASRQAVSVHNPVRSSDTIPRVSKVGNSKCAPLDVEAGVEKIQLNDLRNVRIFAER
jgi:hypothetical protein